MKRLNAPKKWMLDKLSGVWAPRPSSGPHRMRESFPLVLILRNRLKYALTRQESNTIVMRRLVKIDGKTRTDINFPCGFQDVISIDKTDEKFRVLYDVKGRFVLHRIGEEEAKYKLCRVVKKAKANKASIGRNPFQTGQAASIPYIVTHDGRTIRYCDPVLKANDTVKVDIATGKIVDHCKFEQGNVCMITRGANAGRVGTIVNIERHLGGFDIVHLKDKKDQVFATRSMYVFVIGSGVKSWISIPKAKGIKLSIMEEQEKKESSKGKKN
jgi:small subunit ribosomal protein S4e